MSAPFEIVGPLCRGEGEACRRWLDEGWSRLPSSVAVIVIGGGLYGVVLGVWRSPLQGLYAAIKFPLLILVTSTCMAMLSGMLAPLLGARLTMRQGILAIMFGYAIVGAILGSLAPVMLFLLWSLPDAAAPGASYHTHVLSCTGVIALAGIIANFRLLALLECICPSRTVARRVLFAWLAGHMFVGCQLSWNLRPFFGSPGIEVGFLRADAFGGSFYESVFSILVGMLQR